MYGIPFLSFTNFLISGFHIICMTRPKNKIYDTIYLKIIDQLIQKIRRFLFETYKNIQCLNIFLMSTSYTSGFSSSTIANSFIPVQFSKHTTTPPLSSIKRMTFKAVHQMEIRLQGSLVFSLFFPSVYSFQFLSVAALILIFRPSVLMSKPLPYTVLITSNPLTGAGSFAITY